MNNVLKIAKSYLDQDPKINKILELVPHLEGGFIFEALRDEYKKTQQPVAENFKFFSDDEQLQHLKKLSKIGKSRMKLYAGLSLSSDEIDYLLSRTRNVKETLAIITNHKVSLKSAIALKYSKRSLSRTAYQMLLEYNLYTGPEWAFEALNLNIERIDKDITNLIVSDVKYKNFFVEKLSSARDMLSLKLKFLALYSKEDLIKEYNYALSEDLSYAINSKIYTQATVVSYLGLLTYYLEKNKISIGQEIINLLNFHILEVTSSTPNYLKPYHSEILSNLDKTIAESLGIHSIVLDSYDYDYILNNVGFTVSIAFRVDLDLTYIEKYMSNKSIPADYESTYDGTDKSRAIRLILGEMNFYSSQHLTKNIYKLVPYYLLDEYHQSIETGTRRLGRRRWRWGGHHLSKAFSCCQVEEINKLYELITPEAYPNIDPISLRKIKKRLTYAYKDKFIFEEGAFRQRWECAVHPSRENSTFPKIPLPEISRKSSFDEELIRILKTLSTCEEFEKFIKIFKKAPSYFSQYRVFKNHHYPLTYLLELSKDINSEQLETALAMLPEWQGSQIEFEKMVVLL